MLEILSPFQMSREHLESIVHCIDNVIGGFDPHKTTVHIKKEELLKIRNSRDRNLTFTVDYITEPRIDTSELREACKMASAACQTVSVALLKLIELETSIQEKLNNVEGK